jgi:hypothetical protein
MAIHFAELKTSEKKRTDNLAFPTENQTFANIACGKFSRRLLPDKAHSSIKLFPT